MAEPTPRRNEPRLRPAPLLFEPTQVAADPEHFFDLESIEDPRALLARATELTLAFRAATDRAVEYQAIAAAQLADPRRFDRLTTAAARAAYSPQGVNDEEAHRAGRDARVAIKDVRRSVGLGRRVAGLWRPRI